MKCPKCGLVQSSRPECKRCGSAVANPSPLAAPAAAKPPRQAPPALGAPENPYAPPTTGPLGPPPERSFELYRDGRMLVVRDGAPFPDRCVRCNEPAGGYRLKKTFYWHPPGWYLLILASILIYAIVALFVRKKATFEISLCSRHRDRRRLAIALALGVPVATLFAWIASGIDVLGLVFAVVIVAGAVVGVLGVAVLTPKRIEEEWAYFRGAHPDFLARLPAVG